MRLSGGVILALVAGAGLAVIGASPAHGTARRPLLAPDSVTVRVASRVWGGELEQCTGLNWNWDSLTWRLAPGNSVGGDFLGARFSLGHIISPDSAWVIYPMQELGVNGRWSDPVRSPEFDSVIVTSRPTAFKTINVKDAEAWFRVKLVTPWPEPPPKPIRTATLSGRVVDDSTGCGVYFCQVVVIGTTRSARTDTLGAFTLDVPVGQVQVEACAGGYVRAVVVRVPRDTLVFRFPHDPRRLARTPCR